MEKAEIIFLFIGLGAGVIIGGLAALIGMRLANRYRGKGTVNRPDYSWFNG